MGYYAVGETVSAAVETLKIYHVAAMGNGGQYGLTVVIVGSKVVDIIASPQGINGHIIYDSNVFCRLKVCRGCLIPIHGYGGYWLVNGFSVYNPSVHKDKKISTQLSHTLDSQKNHNQDSLYTPATLLSPLHLVPKLFL